MEQDTCCDDDWFYEAPALVMGTYGSLVVNNTHCHYCNRVVKSEIIDDLGNIPPKEDSWRDWKEW